MKVMEMEYTFIIEDFPQKIEGFDGKLRKALRNVKGWSYSYDTKTFTLELEEAFEDKISKLKEAVKTCL